MEATAVGRGGAGPSSRPAGSVNLARKANIDPGMALRGTNLKFDRRFRRVEALLAAGGRSPSEASLEEMDALWAEADLDDVELDSQAVEAARSPLDQLDDELARHGGPWLLGESYSALDPYAMMLCRWTRGFSSAPARDRTQLGPYLQRVLARPAVQRVFAAEQLAQPWV